MQRRAFIQKTAGLTGGLLLGSTLTNGSQQTSAVMTVNGPLDANQMGITLVHEHILVDFIGAAKINPSRWKHDDVVYIMLPYLKQFQVSGGKTFVDCTPNYLGRDVILLRKLAEESGVNIITNTGYYGGSDHKFLPEHAFTESAEQLAKRWIDEWENGIDGTGIKPGFIKISVNPEKLSKVSRKLIEAAGITHKRTGLTIASHTGPFIPALEQIRILEEQRVMPEAFIWVHAQTEQDMSLHERIARLGAWVSLDGLSDDNVDRYVEMLLFMRNRDCLHRTLVSHDAGWFDPAKEEGGEVRGYMTLMKKLLPELRKRGFGPRDIDQLLKSNPQKALAIQVKTI